MGVDDQDDSEQIATRMNAFMSADKKYLDFIPGLSKSLCLSVS